MKYASDKAEVGLSRPTANSANMDLYDSILNPEDGPVASTSTLPVEEQEDGKVEKVINLDSLTALNAKSDKTGIVYLSRVPPGMGPAKLKHLLSHYGDTGRVYLARDPRGSLAPFPLPTHLLITMIANTDAKTAKAGKHTSHRFAEGWIEFLDKRIARSTAELLNAQPIGGKPSSPFYHDLWSCKYLPKFKWNMLSGSISQQQAIETALLRNEISQSKKDQAGYLRQVEKARVQGKIEEKREKKRKEAPAAAPAAINEGEEKPKKKQRAFKQRTTVKADKATKANDSQALQGVLNSLFA